MGVTQDVFIDTYLKLAEILHLNGTYYEQPKVKE